VRPGTGLPEIVPLAAGWLHALKSVQSAAAGGGDSALSKVSIFEDDRQPVTDDNAATAEALLDCNRRLADLELRSNELERLNAGKTRLLACASHDLRQPLQALRLLIDLLAAGAKDTWTAGIATKLGIALKGAEELLNDLLEVSRFDLGQTAVQAETFPLSKLLTRLAAECGPVAAEKGLAFRIEETDAILHADPVLLHRAIRNLVSNAIRYTDRGQVVVRCRKRGPSAVAIQVWDSGRGIPRDKRESIFEDFYRIEHAAGGSEKEGLGLGLAIVARSAKLLNARVTVHSRPGHGTAFSFILPVAVAA
jgi:two-component system, sensor histidine kinase